MGTLYFYSKCPGFMHVTSNPTYSLRVAALLRLGWSIEAMHKRTKTGKMPHRPAVSDAFCGVTLFFKALPLKMHQRLNAFAVTFWCIRKHAQWFWLFYIWRFVMSLSRMFICEHNKLSYFIINGVKGNALA